MKDNDIIRKSGTDLVLLSLLKQRDMYGYELRQLISEYSNQLYEIPEGSMYIFLYRLSENGLISERKELVGKRRTRVYYHLEPAGDDYLKDLYERFQNSMKGLSLLIAKTMGEEAKKLQPVQNFYTDENSA